jgi:hypothetical protein
MEPPSVVLHQVTFPPLRTILTLHSSSFPLDVRTAVESARIPYALYIQYALYDGKGRGDVVGTELSFDPYVGAVFGTEDGWDLGSMCGCGEREEVSCSSRRDGKRRKEGRTDSIPSSDIFEDRSLNTLIPALTLFHHLVFPPPFGNPDDAVSNPEHSSSQQNQRTGIRLMDRLASLLSSKEYGSLHHSFYTAFARITYAECKELETVEGMGEELKRMQG